MFSAQGRGRTYVAKPRRTATPNKDFCALGGGRTHVIPLKGREHNRFATNALVGIVGVEPTIWGFTDPFSPENYPRIVNREGFEPPNSMRPDLQSGGFNHSPTYSVVHSVGVEPTFVRLKGGSIASLLRVHMDISVNMDTENT